MSGPVVGRLGILVVVGVTIAAGCSSSSDGGAALPLTDVGPTTAAPDTSPESPGGAADTSTPTDPSTPPPRTPDPTSPADTVPSATSDPTPGIAVAYGGGRVDVPWAPLGWWDGAAWRDQMFSIDGTWVGPPEPTVTGVAATSLDLPDGPAQVVTGLSAGPEERYCVGDERGPTIDLGVTLPETPLSIGFDAVAVTADWPLQPRAVRQIGAEVPVYADVGAALMADLVDTAADGEVVQVVRADLDADGDEEVLVSYERRLQPDMGGAGDFTSVYVRVPAADGSVDDQLVASFVSEDPDEMEFPFPTPGRMTIVGVADLNGDGVMEVALRDLFWEYGGISVFAFVDGQLERVMAGGCGV